MSVMIKGSSEQIQQAEERYNRHLIACRKLNVLPEHKLQFIADHIRDSKSLEDLESYEWSADNITDNVTEQRYHQYESPRFPN